MADNVFEVHDWRRSTTRSTLTAATSMLCGHCGGAWRPAGVGHRLWDGEFAILLADRGFEVTGIDPALASLDVARAKTGSSRVRWIHGDSASLPPLQVDLATMTGNVAQAIVQRADWEATLRGVHDTLRPGGSLVFETRDPAYEAWQGGTARSLLRH